MFARLGRLRGAGAITVLQTLSKGLAFLRELLVAALFGASKWVDAFVVAVALYSLFAPLISDALQTLATPVLSKLHGKDTGAEHKVSSDYLRVNLLAFAALTLAAFALLEPLIGLLAAGLPQATRALIAGYAWLLLPFGLLTALQGLLTSQLNAQEKYGLSELVLLVMNVAVLGFLYVLARVTYSFALPLSLSLGAVVGLLLFVLVVRPRIRLGPLDNRVKASFAMLPAMLSGYGLVQVNILVDRYFASSLPTGSIAAISYANKLTFLPLSVVVAGVIAISFVGFSKADTLHSALAILKKSSLLTVALLAPFALLLGLFAYPVTRLLYFRGAFDLHALELTSQALQVLSLAIVPLGLAQVFQKFLYAHQDSRSVLAASLLSVVSAVACNFALVPLYGMTGLLWATVIANVVLDAALLTFIWQRARREVV
ncbi:lipid II flippase MurJ [Deinococcus lacus]|uniref:Lipid II flippase MurJ n=1 Tax=Deinococcus lacus TaxID=392561 RepID=A0ABW1YH31_9DEIO